MRYFFTIVVNLAVLLPFSCLAQESSAIEPWLELIQKDAALAELLQDLQENPIAVNTANKADWQRIPLLSESMIDKILTVRRKKGEFKSVRQIKALVGANWFRRIRPFIILNPRPHQHFFWLQRNYRTLENPQGIYSGSNLYSFSKTKVRYNKKIDAGIVTQKDVGEAQWTDYMNGYIQFNTKKIRLIAGSFYIQLGQGLVFSSAFGRMKSTLVTLPFTSTKDRAAAYLGSAENFAQTGLFSQIQCNPKTKVRFALSRTLRDGQYNPFTKKTIGFDYTGYHRNPKEQNQKDLIAEQLLALNISHKFSGKMKLGLLFARFIFTPSIEFTSQNIPFSELRRRYFHFKGRFLNLGSIYYHFENDHFSMAGEWAVSDFSHHAFNQTLFVWETNVKFGIIFWQLNRDYQTPLGRVFDDQSPFPGAQQGVYGAFVYDFGRGTMRFYKLIKKNLWRTYFDPLPILHDEWLSQSTFRFSKVKLIVRVRHRVDDDFLSVNGHSSERINRSHTSLRMEADYGPAKKVLFRTRLEWCRISPFKEKGILMFQDIKFWWAKNLQTYARLSFFRTRSYTSRIYEYENDVPGSFANIALYGQGFKWYLQINWRISRYMRVWFKYRYLYFNERDFNCIDYGKIKRPFQRLIRMQFEVRF